MLLKCDENYYIHAETVHISVNTTWESKTAASANLDLRKCAYMTQIIDTACHKVFAVKMWWKLLHPCRHYWHYIAALCNMCSVYLSSIVVCRCVACEAWVELSPSWVAGTFATEGRWFTLCGLQQNDVTAWRHRCVNGDVSVHWLVADRFWARFQSSAAHETNEQMWEIWHA